MYSQRLESVENSYVEILEILKYVEKKYVNKIPKTLIDFFDKNKSKNYNFKYNNNLDLSSQNLDNNTLALLAMINLQYWCEDEKHKAELIALYNENEHKYQEELNEKYSYENMFKNKKGKSKESIVNEVNETNEASLVEYKESKFKQIIEKIKRIFHI